ncbi:MAG: PKD domain-containing protein [Ferruginibacter sp.]
MKHSSVFRIDEKVAFSMIGICVLSVIILAFKSVSGNKDLEISIVHDDSVYTHSQAHFKVVGPKGKIYVWNFGDSSFESYADTTAMHKYKKAGSYIVTVTVDGQSKDIIKQDVFGITENVMESPEVKISFQDPSYVNNAVTFSVNFSGDASVEWYFENSTQPSSISTTVTRTFSTNGPKKIELKINPGKKDEKIISRYINILEKTIEPSPSDKVPGQRGGPADNSKPRTQVEATPGNVPPITTKEDKDKDKVDLPKPVPPVKPAASVVTAPEISQDAFQALLREINSKKHPKSLQDFSQYLCGNLNIPVVFNGKPMTFSIMYGEINDASKRKTKNISVVGFQYSKQTHCVQSVTVTD